MELEDYDKYIKISEEIKEKAEELKKILEPYEEMVSTERLDVIQLRKEMIKKLTRENIDLMNKIIGQIYNGILISKVLTIRNEKVYDYRKSRSQMRLRRIYNIFLDMQYVTEIKGKIGEENFNIIKNLLEDNKDIILNEDCGRNETIENFKASYELEKPIKFCKFGYGYEGVEFKEIKLILVNEGEVRFLENAYSYKNINDVIRLILYKKYEDIISKISKELVEKLDKIINDLKEKQDKIKKDGGKFLICANLSQN